MSEKEREKRKGLLLTSGGGVRELFIFKMKGVISIKRVRKTQQFLY